MNKEAQSITLRNLSFQRNVLLFLSISLSIATTALAIAHFFKNERTIVVPPVIHDSFWVDATSVSPSYLEQLALYMGQLLLSKTAETAENQRETLLNHTHASFAGMLHKKLIEEEKKMKLEKTSYAFFPLSVSARPGTLEVDISGERNSYLNDKKLSSKKETYTLSFAYTGGRLLLVGVRAEEAKHD